MIRYTFDCDQYIGYPVGKEMNSAIEISKGMAKTFKQINEFNGRELVLYCRGSSGAILASLFIAHLQWPSNVTINHVKKEGENAHAGNSYIDRPSPNDVVIVIDDIISSGGTLRNILKYVPEDHWDCLILGSSSSTSPHILGSKTQGRLPKTLICH